MNACHTHWGAPFADKYSHCKLVSPLIAYLPQWAKGLCGWGDPRARGPGSYEKKYQFYLRIFIRRLSSSSRRIMLRKTPTCSQVACARCVIPLWRREQPFHHVIRQHGGCIRMVDPISSCEWKRASEVLRWCIWALTLFMGKSFARTV